MDVNSFIIDLPIVGAYENFTAFFSCEQNFFVAHLMILHLIIV
jgi:hypothetical protein